jgi:hypothetical protein
MAKKKQELDLIESTQTLVKPEDLTIKYLKDGRRFVYLGEEEILMGYENDDQVLINEALQKINGPQWK